VVRPSMLEVRRWNWGHMRLCQAADVVYELTIVVSFCRLRVSLAVFAECAAAIAMAAFRSCSGGSFGDGRVGR